MPKRSRRVGAWRVWLRRVWNLRRETSGSVAVYAAPMLPVRPRPQGHPLAIR